MRSVYLANLRHVGTWKTGLKHRMCSEQHGGEWLSVDSNIQGSTVPAKVPNHVTAVKRDQQSSTQTEQPPDPPSAASAIGLMGFGGILHLLESVK
jgi:hypothetical protein